MDIVYLFIFLKCKSVLNAVKILTRVKSILTRVESILNRMKHVLATQHMFLIVVNYMVKSVSNSENLF